MRIAFAFVFAAACGSKSTPATPEDAPIVPPADARPDAADHTAPEIVSTTPIADSADQAQASTITVVFSEPIDPATVTDASFYLQLGAVHVPGAIAVAGDTATFTPADPLVLETQYAATIEATVADLAGNTLVAARTFRFSTLHRRRVFVTSIQNTGRLASWPGANGLQGLAAGDAACQARAVAAGREGTFVAWLSDDTNDAYCRAQGFSGKRAANCGQAQLPTAAGPWVRIDGVPWSDGTTVFTPVLQNELGDPAPQSYFSNTLADGTAVASSCTNWTTGLFVSVGYGGTRTTGTFWTQWGQTFCNSFASLLCLEVGGGAASQFPAQVGKRVFVTSTSTTGKLGSSPDAGGATGLAAGDAICQTRATAAGLTGTFKAWLSDDVTAASTRITSTGPWSRLDGLPIATTRADLLDGILATTISQTETGAYVSDVQAWTNTTFTGLAAGASCTNWTSEAGVGFAGRVNDSVGHWTRDASIDCAVAHRLYCVED